MQPQNRFEPIVGADEATKASEDAWQRVDPLNGGSNYPKPEIEADSVQTLPKAPDAQTSTSKPVGIPITPPATGL